MTWRESDFRTVLADAGFAVDWSASDEDSEESP